MIQPKERPQRSLITFLREHQAIELRLLLGLFVMWHAFTLITSNLGDFLGDAKEDKYAIWKKLTPETPKDEKRSPNRFERWVDFTAEELKKGDFWDKTYYRIRRGGDIWLRLTGQEQGWSLFAPWIARYSSFIAVEMRWDDDLLPSLPIHRRFAALTPCPWSRLTTEVACSTHRPRSSLLLLSYNEPENIHSYFRFKNYRVRRFESNFEMDLRVEGRTVEEAHRAWSNTIYQRVWRERNEIAAYLRWRVKRYREEHPGTPMPTQVRMLMRTYTINGPREDHPFRWSWHPADMNVPIARWLPWRTYSIHPVQYFDTETGRFKDYSS